MKDASSKLYSRYMVGVRMGPGCSFNDANAWITSNPPPQPPKGVAP